MPYRRLLVALACVASLAGAQVTEPQLSLSAGADVGVAGHYVRRGERLGSAGLTGRLYAERGFEGGLLFRGQVAAFTQFDGLDFSESIYDAALGLHQQRWLGRSTLLMGYTYYARNTNPANPAFVGSNTQELYAGLETAGPGRPWAYVRWDFDGGAGRHNDRVGVYFMAGASHRIPVNRDIAVDLAGRLGFDFGRGVGGFNDALLQSRLNLRLSHRLSLVPALDWWFPSGQVWGGVHGFQLVPSLGLSYAATF